MKCDLPTEQISKVAIRNYQIGRRIPHCGFELEFLSEQVQRLRHKVVVTGVSSSLTTFTIRYPQQTQGDYAFISVAPNTFSHSYTCVAIS